MAKSKKTKIHKKTDGQLLQMNKSFNNLKMKQKDKITAWVYEEYKKYVTENEKVPDSEADEHIIDEVLDKINEAQIWIPSGEIVSYYYRKKLVNKNQGKTKTIEKIWNKKFGQYVPKDWARSSDCEVHKKKVPIEPAWEYHIISIKRL